MAAALPIIARLKIAAAAKADFGLVMLIAPGFRTITCSGNPTGNQGVSDARATKCHRNEGSRRKTASFLQRLRGLVTENSALRQGDLGNAETDGHSSADRSAEAKPVRPARPKDAAIASRRRRLPARQNKRPANA